METPYSILDSTLNYRTTYYVYDAQNIIAEYDENNRLIASYVHGPNIDEPLSAEIRRDWIYYHAGWVGEYHNHR